VFPRRPDDERSVVWWSTQTSGALGGMAQIAGDGKPLFAAFCVTISRSHGMRTSTFATIVIPDSQVDMFEGNMLRARHTKALVQVVGPHEALSNKIGRRD